jgi:hypothetical protein
MVFSDPPSPEPEPARWPESAYPWETPAAEGIPASGTSPQQERKRRPRGVLALVVALVVAVIAGGVALVTTLGSREDTRGAALTRTSPAAQTPQSSAAPAASSATPTRSSSPARARSATAVAPSAAPAAPRPQPVPALPQPVAAWTLSRGSGTAESGTQNLTPTSITAVRGAAGFNGTNSQMTTAGPVLDTGANSSFTVAAAVFLDETNGFRTVVSQDGAQNSGFYLQYAKDDNRWSFTRVTNDAPAPGSTHALSINPPATSQWVHLVGTYDAGTNQLSLYVGNQLQSTVIYTTPFATTGKLAIGRGHFQDNDDDYFHGAISDVKIYKQALTATQIRNIRW